MEIKTDGVKPYHITEGRAEDFGKATQDFNKFHEKYAYGSQVTGWTRNQTNELLKSGGLELKCAKQESRFSAIPIPIGSQIRLPRVVRIEYDDREKQARVAFNLYFKDDAEEKDPIVEAVLVYRANLQTGRAELAGSPLSTFELRQKPAELVAAALEREGIDLQTLAFGYASPALQEQTTRIINPGELPIFLSQKIEFYDTTQPLKVGDNIYIAITNAKRRKGIGGGERETIDTSVIDLTTAKDEPNGEIITKTRFIIGIIGQGQAVELAEGIKKVSK